MVYCCSHLCGGSVVVVSWFIVALICVGVPCLVLVLLFSILCPSSFAINGEERENWLLYFNCLPDVLLLLVLYGSSSGRRGLV